MSAMSGKATVRSPSASAPAAVAVALLLPAGPAMPHAAIMDIAAVEAVVIHARYETGEAMDGAQILVFAPDDPARPWHRGVADAEGRFHFVPDGRPGRWAIQARQAGHGVMGYVTIEAVGAGGPVAAAPPAAGLGWMQKLLMIACVAWGCVGTAAFFHRTRGGKAG